MAHQFRLGNKIRKGRYFGFREGRSMTDAIAHVRALSNQSVSRGGVAIAVSFDIANAFNTLLWRIREALIYHRVPLYLRRVVGAFLEGRTVSYVGRSDVEGRKGIIAVRMRIVLFFIVN